MWMQLFLNLHWTLFLPSLGEREWLALPKQLSIQLSWFCLSLSVLRTTLPQLKMEKVPAASDLQLPQKSVCESYRGVPGDTYGGEAQLPLPPPSWVAQGPGKHLIDAYLHAYPPSSLSSPPNSCQGSSGRRSSPPPSSPSQSCLLKTRERTQLTSPLPLAPTCPLHTDLWNFIHQSLKLSALFGPCARTEDTR